MESKDPLQGRASRQSTNAEAGTWCSAILIRRSVLAVRLEDITHL